MSGNRSNIIAPEDLKVLVKKAAEFHGHLGPFLVIGIRIGLIGLKRIGKPENKNYIIDLSLPLHVPFSCIIDGVQVATQCTIGNQKLSLLDSDFVQARFKRTTNKNGEEVTVALNSRMFEEIKSRLLAEAKPEEVSRLAWIVANISEDELFQTS